MPILIHCPDCGAKIRAPEKAIGRQIRCPKCDAEFTAQSNAAPAPPAEAPPPEPVPEPVAAGAAPPPEANEAPKSASVEAIRRELPVDGDEEEDEDESPPAMTPESYGPPRNPLVDVLLFRMMITPIIIQFLFWLGVIACVIGGGITLVVAIGLMVSGNSDVTAAFIQALLGLGLIVLGPLAIRLVCELNILFFRIYDTLREMQMAAEKQRRLG